MPDYSVCVGEADVSSIHTMMMHARRHTSRAQRVRGRQLAAMGDRRAWVMFEPELKYRKEGGRKKKRKVMNSECTCLPSMRKAQV